MSGYRTLAEAMRPRLDRQTLANARRAITDDGRPRLDRGYGPLPRQSLVALAAESIRTEPSSTSIADYLADQLQDVGDLVVENAVTAVDTTSINMDATFNGTNIEISGVVNFAGSGSASTAAHSDHTHSGVYQPIALTATAVLDFASIAAGAIGTLNITVTGATVGATVVLGPPAGIETGLIWAGRVSSADTVTIRLLNTTGSAVDPASATWRATVL